MLLWSCPAASCAVLCTGSCCLLGVRDLCTAWGVSVPALACKHNTQGDGEVVQGLCTLLRASVVVDVTLAVWQRPGSRRAIHASRRQMPGSVFALQPATTCPVRAS